MEVDLELTVIRWNPAAERIFGWSRDEVIGRPGLPMVPRSQQAEHRELVERARAGGGYTGHETVRLRKDGTLIDVTMSAAPVREETGRVVGHVVVYQDITERKRQEAELRRLNAELEARLAELGASEERLQAVIESSPVAILEVNLETRVTRWNAAAERIFGWSREEMVGHLGVPLVPESRQAEFEELVAKVRGGRAYTGFETLRQRKDGTLLDVEISAAPVRDAGGHVVSHMVVFSDITRRKAQEVELRRLNAELEARLDELAASRARIVGTADAERRRLERNLHDGAQQRLVTLSLSLRLALARLDTDPAAARDLLAGAAEELGRALEELRELARGIHPAVLTDRGLGAALESLASRLPVPVAVVEVPAERLAEPIEAAAYYLVAEALTNVAKYAQATGARVRVGQADGTVVVEVSDDGVGGADAVAGSGLRGLADRVEALGGRLEVSSPAGAGTSLRAEIPLA
jgi:PAS domain S-box-containing protein